MSAQPNNPIANAEEVLQFWFGDTTKRSASEVAAEKSPLWWSKNLQTDAEIRDRFAATTAAVTTDALEHWGESPRGLLALILCTDQFPRNMHRGAPEAFADDARALAYAERCVADGFIKQLRPIERVFAYLPFEHSEEVRMQQRSLARYEALAADVSAAVDARQAPPEDRKLFHDYVGFARQHYDIIVRFGRFPHRNEILRRATTEEERIFLTQPNSSF